MKQVDIYIYTSSKAPQVNNGKYRYKLKCSGHELEGKGQQETTTAHRLAMICAIEALKRMNRPALVTIHTACRYMINGHGMMGQWKENAWNKRTGKPLKNADLWQELYEQTKQHAIKWEYCPNLVAQDKE